MRRASFLALALVLATGCGRPATDPCSPCAVTMTSAPAGPAPTIAAAPDVASLVARVKPAVVNITTTQDVKVPRLAFRDWPFGDFFGIPGGTDDARIKRQALGSGFIVDSRGYVVTNAHVVENADRVRVRLADERELDAKVKGRDERLDLAVLEIAGAKDLPTVTVGSSNDVRVGDYVIAIGNPFGLGHTVTMGIVSAKSRAIGAGPYDDFIQTDASINPGNSGGPLFDTRGAVIGVNTAINPAGRGIGFAIPIDSVKEVLPQLLEKGHVDRGRLGVQIQRVDDAMGKALGMDRARGALVGEVEANSAGAKAGIRPGDVIVRFDGQEVTHANELPRMVARHAPGSRVKVDVVRDKTTKTFEVTLDALKDDSAKDSGDRPRDDKRERAVDPSGLELEDGDHGVVVRRVRPGSPWSESLEPGDVILEIDKREAKNAREAMDALRSRRTGPVLLRIERNGVSRYLAAEPRS